MAKYADIINHERRLRAFTGLTFAQFTALACPFTTTMERYLQRYTLDGYVREGNRAITYANSPLPSGEDRLLFIMTHLKQNTTQEVHGQLFGMTQSNANKWIHFLMDMMDRTLAVQQCLPARTAQELAAQLQADPWPEHADAPPLFSMTEPNGL